MSSENIHIDAWHEGRRFTHDGTVPHMLTIARMAGVPLGGLVATHLGHKGVFQILENGVLYSPETPFADVVRGSPPIDMDEVRSILRPDAWALVENGTVLVVDVTSDEVPRDVVDQFRKIAAGAHFGFGTKGVACCHRRKDGQVLVIFANGIVDPVFLEHEMIHAAQCHADAEAMGDAFDAVVEDGRALVEAVAAGGGPQEDHRDVDWFRTAATMKVERGELEIDTGLFDMGLLLYPTKETAAVAAGLGIEDKAAVVAALHAYFMVDAGLEIDPSSRLGREIVAHRYQGGDDGRLDTLYASALASVTSAPEPVPAAPRP